MIRSGSDLKINLQYSYSILSECIVVRSTFCEIFKYHTVLGFRTQRASQPPLQGLHDHRGRKRDPPRAEEGYFLEPVRARVH